MNYGIKSLVLTFVLVDLLLALSLIADQKPTVFVFGGKEFYVGMSKALAVQQLSACCKLSPPADSNIENNPVTAGGGHFITGHFITAKGEETQRMLGGIFFSGDRVVRMTRPLADDLDFSNDDLVGFARAMKRALQVETGDSEKVATVSIQHEKISNAESDVIFIQFRDGRGIELHIGILDKPNTLTNKRDFVTLDETLSPAR